MQTPLGFLLTAIQLLFLGAASASVISLAPSADGFLTGGSVDPAAGSPSLNYGGAGALMVSGAGTTKGEIQTVLKFNLASAKLSFDSQYGVGNWQLDQVTLQLGTNFGTQGVQPNNAIFNAVNAGIFKVDWLANDNWGEGNGTPSSPLNPFNPPVDGVTFASLGLLQSGMDRTLGTFSYIPVGSTSPPSVPAATYSLSLDSSFSADILAGNAVSLRAYAGDAGVGYLFNSVTFGTVANRPVLLVSAVPEPGVGLLLLSASWVCLARRRTDV